MTAITNSHILLDDQGRAWVAGTNTKVVEIVLDKLAYGWTPEEVHRQHPHLPLSKIHAVLSYYYDHQVEIDSGVERQVKEIDADRVSAGESPLAAKCRRYR